VGIRTTDGRPLAGLRLDIEASAAERGAFAHANDAKSPLVSVLEISSLTSMMLLSET
jgi:hypothetical protein